MRISSAVELAWQLGGGETVAARKAEIGPIQFFCGVTKLAELIRFSPSSLNALTPCDVERLAAESDSALGALADAGVDLTRLRHELRSRAGTGTHRHDKQDLLHRSESLRHLFRRAQLLMDADGRDVIELRDMVFAMFENRSLVVCRTLEQLGVDLEALLESTGSEPASRAKPDTRATPMLDRIGRDLTALAKAGKLSPVVGRRDELLLLLQTLARRSKNNPVLIGEPGVGKTAVVELLAQRLADGQDDGSIGAKRIVEISMSSLIAGAKYLGDREKRLDTLIAECRGNDDVLLFIDELHTLVAAGGYSGTIDPKDILKPALARGEVRCIGATTIAEYGKYIESDAALERRFDKIVIVEPTITEAVEILEGVAPHLAEHHGIEFDEGVLEAAVELSARFDTEHQLPDKAIDLLDKAAADMRIPALSMAALPDGPRARTPRVSSDAVVEALAHKLGLPKQVLAAHRLPPTHGSGNADLETHLNERILGQTAAARAVAERMRLVEAGLSAREGPRAVMLFLGSTGIGKTEMARTLAEQLFGDERSLIRLDMSEFMDEHDVVKLVGAPPGYIGHNEPGQLTGRLRAKPYAVVLLDEIDKAHPRALDLLLQVFDAGRITDSQGRTIDVRHAVFVMTSNVPADRAGGRIGFLPSTSDERSDQPEIQALKGHFRPEFLNRIDETIVFEPLSADVVRALTEQHVNRIRSKLKVRFGKTLHVDSAVFDHLGTAGFSRDYGARELRRTVEHLFESPLSELLLSGDCAGWRGIAVEFDGDRLRFSPRGETS